MLDGVELFDPGHRLVGLAWTGLFRLDELPPGMGSAADLDDHPLRSSEQFVVAHTGVALQKAVEVLQEP